MPRLIADHDCHAENPMRLERAISGGYAEVYHTSSGALAKARGAVLERTGYQILIENATDGFIVLARPTEALDPSGGTPDAA
jgi:hypothetical protein